MESSLESARTIRGDKLSHFTAKTTSSRKQQFQRVSSQRHASQNLPPPMQI